MGGCACQAKKLPQAKKSGSLTTFQDSPVKRQTKLSSVDEKYQYRLSQDIDPYFTKFQIHEEDFKQHANLKGQSYYSIFYKFKIYSSQIGDIQQYQGISPRLSKSLQKIKLLKEKIERDFRTECYNKASPTLPILNEEIVIYAMKYTQIMIDIFEALEKDPKYEENLPILSFNFKEMKNKLRDILIEVDQVRVNSQGKHKKSEVVVSIKNNES